MPADVQPLGIAELVALVNAWGATPRTVGHRAAPAVPAAPGSTVAADRVYAVFAAAARDRARLVNSMLIDTGVRPALSRSGSATWSVPARRDAPLAAAALTLRECLADRPDRLGVCADPQCADVYVDVSPAGRRRFCSPTCQTRSRVAAFRERRRAAGPVRTARPSGGSAPARRAPGA